MTEPSSLDPAPLIRSSHEQFIPVAQIKEVLGQLDAGRETTVLERAEQADFEAQMSAHLLETLRAYRADNGEVTLLRYSVTKDGYVAMVIDSGQEAPPEDALVHLSATTSTADLGRLSAVGEELIASRATGR